VNVDNVVGSTPVEIRSAGLDWVGTCLKVAEAVSSCMKATLLPTYVFHLFDGHCIHVSTMEESVYKWIYLLLCWEHKWPSCTVWPTM
jgi:hypothetical protein